MIDRIGRWRNWKGRAPALVLAMLALGYASTASAAIRHRYSFTNDANDSVGTAHGTVVDSGTTTNAVFANGQLDLSANTGQSSNTAAATREDAYVDLPNGIVSAAANVNGAVSFEWWFTVSTARNWQRLGDFGTSNGGEDASPSGSTSAYILVTPNSGRSLPAGTAGGLEMTNHPASNASEPNLLLNGPFGTGTERHVVAVYDHNNTTAGPNGTMSMFLDGVQVGTPTVGTGQLEASFNLRTITDNNNWLGRSQWADPIFDGLYNEFRIYDHALTPAQVAASFAGGPNGTPIPEPATVALMVLGLAGLATLRSRS